MANVRFFNCVDFPVNFRMVWLPNAPRVTLQPGAQIEGPFEYLATYNFLRPINPSFGNVSSGVDAIKDQNVPKDIKADIDEQERLRQKYSFNLKQEVSISKEIKLTEAVSNNNSIQKPEQKIEAVKWEKIKLVELIQQAKQLGVYTPEDDKANKVKLKWELIRRIKKKLAEV